MKFKGRQLKLTAFIVKVQFYLLKVKSVFFELYLIDS